MRVLLVDAHHLVRSGIRRLLDALADVEVVAEAASLKKALTVVSASRVDIVVVNPGLPDSSPTDAITELLRGLPRAGVLVISASVEVQRVRESLAAGALGYLAHESNPAELELALLAVSRQQVYITPLISHLLVDRRLPVKRGNVPVFSRRQREVLKLIGQGKATGEIARALDISVKTVETHRARLMESLNLKGSAALMRYALNVGMS